MLNIYHKIQNSIILKNNIIFKRVMLQKKKVKTINRNKLSHLLEEMLFADN